MIYCLQWQDNYVGRQIVCVCLLCLYEKLSFEMMYYFCNDWQLMRYSKFEFACRANQLVVLWRIDLVQSTSVVDIFESCHVLFSADNDA